MIERLKAQMRQQGINARELAERANVGRSFVYDILNGKSTNPTTRKLAAIAGILGVTSDYLLTGQQSNDNVEAIDGASGKAPARQAYVSISSIAVEASMGGGALVTEELEEEPYYFRRSWIRRALGVSPKDLRIIAVRGDSMEPLLHEGDAVLMDLTQTHPDPAGIFALFDGVGLVVKRLDIVCNAEQPLVRIASDNPNYAPYERSLEEIKVIGRVVWFAREL